MERKRINTICQKIDAGKIVTQLVHPLQTYCSAMLQILHKMLHSGRGLGQKVSEEGLRSEALGLKNERLLARW